MKNSFLHLVFAWKLFLKEYFEKVSNKLKKTIMEKLQTFSKYSIKNDFNAKIKGINDFFRQFYAIYKQKIRKVLYEMSPRILVKPTHFQEKSFENLSLKFLNHFFFHTETTKI